MKKTKEEIEKEWKERPEREKIKELKKTIRTTYKIFYWISIFLIIPTIGSYVVEWNAIPIARDIGIGITTMMLWRITRRMKKKEKEEEEKR